jgi:hypothetical protein
MTETRCPQCSQPVRPEFRVCPYCAAPLGESRAELPAVTPAGHEGPNGLVPAGIGLVLLGLLGFVGVILSFGSATRVDPDTVFTVGGGSILVLIAGSVLASVGWGRRRGAAVATGVLGGVAGALMGLLLGGLLVAATIIYAISDCLKGCSPPAAQQQRR